MEDDYSSVVGVSFVMWLTMLVFVLVSGLIGAMRLPRLLPRWSRLPERAEGRPAAGAGLLWRRACTVPCTVPAQGPCLRPARAPSSA